MFLHIYFIFYHNNNNQRNTLEVNMKQGIAVIISLSLYLGSLFLIDSALASGHKGGEGHDNDRGNRASMLFKGIEMTDGQRKEVRQIMNSSMEKGKELREDSKKQGDAIKKDTREQLAGVLDDDQMSQFEKNAKRMNRAKMNKGKMRGDKKRKKMNKHGKGGKGHKHKKKGNKPKNRGS